MARGRAVFAAAAMVCGLTSTALAGPDVYCDAYARDVANRKTGNGADILVGTIGGGTVVGAAAADEKWRASYDKAFAGCMDNYEPREIEAADAPAPVKKSGKPKPGTKEWVAYCAARYRSFDADTGRYKSYSGERRPCR